jgi:hypothetical protein
MVPGARVGLGQDGQHQWFENETGAAVSSERQTILQHRDGLDPLRRDRRLLDPPDDRLFTAMGATARAEQVAKELEA